jgi:hypothetical protein
MKNKPKHWFGMLLSVFVGSANAGNMLRTDVAVGLIADPSIGLQSGQTVVFTISVTNLGPEPIQYFLLGSSLVHDELRPYYGSTPDCEGDSYATGNDIFGPIIEYRWLPGNLTPIAVGETRYCRLSLEFTSAAPASFAFSFGLWRDYTDPDPSNNRATVVLQRGPEPTSVPTLSSKWLSLLAGLLIVCASARCQRNDQNQKQRQGYRSGSFQCRNGRGAHDCE